MSPTEAVDLGSMTYRIHLALDYAHDAAARAKVEQAIVTPFAALPAVTAADWEMLDRKQLHARWSDRQIEQADLVIMLVGKLTYTRPLIRREISSAVRLQKPIFGLYVDPKLNGLNCPSPFSYVMAGNTGTRYQIHALPTSDLSAYLRQCIEEILPVPAERRAASSAGGTLLI